MQINQLSNHSKLAILFKLVKVQILFKSIILKMRVLFNKDLGLSLVFNQLIMSNNYKIHKIEAMRDLNKNTILEFQLKITIWFP